MCEVLLVAFTWTYVSGVVVHFMDVSLDSLLGIHMPPRVLMLC